jgi:hypothetical protein
MYSQAAKLTKALPLAVAVLLSLFLFSCTIHEQKSADNKKKVDINTPFGGIHVNTDAKASDTGLDVYPGAQPKERPDSNHDGENANVNVQVGDFGVRVIATSYVSNDPPEKIIGFYRDNLKRYGNVLECPKGLKENHGGDGPREMVCNDSGTTEKGKMDLAVGNPDRQRVVSVKPHGSGTEFAVVYIQMRGGKDSTI